MRVFILLKMSLFIGCMQVCAQALKVPVKADCKDAITLVFDSLILSYGPTLPPKSYGTLMEIRAMDFNPIASFSSEHHSAWYFFTIPVNGELSMELIPENIKDDYDFMLFKVDSGLGCKQILQDKIRPVRSNISRNKRQFYSKTGLAKGAVNNWVGSGINPAYSSVLKVDIGNSFILVCDNVYPKGDGHTLKLNLEAESLPAETKYSEADNTIMQPNSAGFRMSGVIMDENFNPLMASVTIEDENGAVVEQSFSNKNGTYFITSLLQSGLKYTVNIINDSSFVYSYSILAPDEQLDSFKVVLPRLIKGSKYKLGNINFAPGTDFVLTESMPSIRNLTQLMNKSPNLKIKIVGHINGCNGSNNYGLDNFTFSRKRAEAIKNLLVKNGIRSSRIQTEGKGCQEMIFPNALTETEQKENRRVEIIILEY